MKTLTFNIEIQAKPEKIWEALWNKESYPKWTKPFAEGCYYLTKSFTQGNEINFLSPKGDGMLSKINSLTPLQYVAFEHIGMIMEGKKSFFKDDGDNHQYLETYQLDQNEKSTMLTVKVDTLEPWEEAMNTSFPQALLIVKELSEL